MPCYITAQEERINTRSKVCNQRTCSGLYDHTHHQQCRAYQGDILVNTRARDENGFLSLVRGEIQEIVAESMNWSGGFAPLL